MIVLQEMERDNSSDKPERVDEDESAVESLPKVKNKDTTTEGSEKDGSPIKKLRGIFGF
jgi:hypothetical protein